MNRYYFSPIILTLTFFFFGFMAHQEKDIVQLWSAGVMHDDEVLGKTGETWLGLFHDDTGFQLKSAIITVIDSPGISESDKFVKTNVLSDNIFLIKGLPELRTGPVKTVFYGSQSLTSSNSINLSLYNRYFNNLIATGKDSGELILNYQIKLGDGKQNQIILKREPAFIEAFPILLWAGDLDRDGKLDYLIDMTNQYNVTLLTLFLSSKAEGEQLVKKVASYRRIGC